MNKTSPSIRQWSISVSIALMAIIALVMAIILFIKPDQNQVFSTDQPYANNILSPPRPALSFDLVNQHGNSVSLESFGDNPVLITFLYTQCTKACPLITGKLQQLNRILDNTGIHLEIVAISVDPKRDSIAEVYDYSQKWNMEDDWHYLVGTPEQLSPIWEYYWAQPTAGSSELQKYLSHSPPVFLVTNHEIIVAMSNANFEPNLLANYLATLGQ